MTWTLLEITMFYLQETHEGKAGTVTSQSTYPLALLNRGAMSYFYIMSTFLFVIFINSCHSIIILISCRQKDTGHCLGVEALLKNIANMRRCWPVGHIAV